MFVIFTLIPALVVLASLIDIITRDSSLIRHLPKLLWVVLVIILPIIGSFIWWTVGREYSRPVSVPSLGDPRRWDVPRASTRALTPEEEEAAIDAEVAFHENQARIRRLQAEIRERRGRER